MNQRLKEFDYLRGLAIVLIVLGHSIFLWRDGFPLLLENLLRGGTGLFVFISGFFFHRVFIPRFSYIKFITKKFQLVFVPFVVISFIGLIFLSIGWITDGHDWPTVLLNCWYTIRNGFVLYPHWYIPFILLTFIVSPLHIQFSKMNYVTQVVILIGFSVAALFMHRPDSNINLLQSLIYFTPFYLLGIIFSCHESNLRLWRKWLFGFSLIAVVSAVYLQSYIYIHIGNYHKYAFDYAGLDLQFIQMFFGCLVMLELSRAVKPGVLANHLFFLAGLSFPIFFIHPLFSMGLENFLQLTILAEWVQSKSVMAALIATGIIFIIQCYGSVAVVLLLRRCLGMRARWIVG